MEESLDWLIKDCAQQLFALTELTENAKYPHTKYHAKSLYDHTN